MSEAVTVACSAVWKRYGKFDAVRGVDVTLRRAEIVGLLGANGAGKTTLMRLLCGLAQPTDGTARVLNATAPLPPAVLRRLGAMLDSPAFYPWMTGERLLRTLLDTAGLPDDGRVAEALGKVGLAGVGKRIRAYSMGMRQRLALATALVKRPDVLILDEPTNGLDPDGVRAVRDLLAAERARGVSILVSSHQLDELQRLCDRIMLMDHGKIIAAGTLDELGIGAGRSLEDAFFALRGGAR